MSDYDHDQLHRAFQIFGLGFCTWVEGYRDGIRRNAVHRDGRQVVGILEEPLEKVLEQIDAITADLVAAADAERLPGPDLGIEDPAGSRWVRTQDLVVGDLIRCYGDEWRVVGFCSNGDAEVRFVGGDEIGQRRRTISKGNEVLLLGSEVSPDARAEILRNDA